MKHGKEMAYTGHPAARGVHTGTVAKGQRAPGQPEHRAGGGHAANEERWRRIAEAAYYRAQARGFAPGQEIEDWLQAEADIDRGRGGV